MVLKYRISDANGDYFTLFDSGGEGKMRRGMAVFQVYLDAGTHQLRAEASVEDQLLASGDSGIFSIVSSDEEEDILDEM